MMIMNHAERVVRSYIAACNGSDFEELVGLLHPDVELHEASTLPGAVSAVGLEDVQRYLRRFDSHWSSFEWEILELETRGDRAAVRARLKLTGRRSGIDVDREWSYLFTVRDGKLLCQQGYDDYDAALAALGEPA